MKHVLTFHSELKNTGESNYNPKTLESIAFSTGHNWLLYKRLTNHTSDWNAMRGKWSFQNSPKKIWPLNKQKKGNKCLRTRNSSSSNGKSPQRKNQASNVLGHVSLLRALVFLDHASATGKFPWQLKGFENSRAKKDSNGMLSTQRKTVNWAALPLPWRHAEETRKKRNINRTRRDTS